ncbi:MAG: DUF1446 domain-containing protein [Pirellulaceae bacterium]|jgi:hypothetical protein|nr:DUF1446 domain-containing protein [Pirellulaceae bacterium]MDP7304174.1 DUF1446 domain-containing protein [Pirellulaceae bacterium]
MTLGITPVTIRIANGAGFLGDDIDAPRRLVESVDVDYLTLEYLAELTMSILARARQKDPQAGYAKDFLDVASSLLPALRSQELLRIVTNAGGVNPLGCARSVARRLVDAGLPGFPVAAVTGDDLLGQLVELRQHGCRFANLETGQPLTELSDPIVAANAYLGAQPIVESLGLGARVVIAGRVADASLTVGPAVHEFDWDTTDWDRLSAATVAGHLIECGAQVTGGYSQRWRDHDPCDVGYPIAELVASGEAVITKPAGTGGIVDRQSVVEQLVYEIGDPRHYLTPDVVADFASVKVESVGPDRVRVHGATGTAAPDDYKVSLAYQAGYTASSLLLVYGADCVEKSQHCGEIVRHRLERAGYRLEAFEVELLGLGGSVPGLPHSDADVLPREIIVRISVRDQNREAVARFAKELAPLVTSGPSGLAGYAVGRADVRPVFAYWPTLVPKSLIQPVVRVQSADQWLQEAVREGEVP